MVTQNILDYTAAEHLQEFLGIQSENATTIQSYTSSNTRFSEGLGLIVQPIGPVGDWVTDRGVDVAGWVSEFFAMVQRQLGQVKAAVQEADEEAVAELWRLAGRLEGPGKVLADTIGSGGKARPSGSNNANAAITIPAPVAGRDPLPEIRSGLGPIVSTVDEVYSRLIGNGSLVEKYLFEPLAGDWAAIQKASDAWGKAGAGYSSMADRLIEYSLPVDWWEGAAAEAFQALMNVAKIAADWMQWGYELVGTGVNYVAEVVIAACEGIAEVIGYLEKIATRILAKLKIPLVGWGTLAWKAKGYIDEFRGHIDTIKGIIAEVEAVIADAQSMKENFEERVQKARDLQGWVTSL